MMERFCFVILHYQTLNDTIACVNSIISNINYASYNIIVVDNGSTNSSGQQIGEKFENLSNFKLIKSATNLGFARGNNLGFQFAKKVLKSDYIILINNDTEIFQSNFIDLIIHKYKQSPFHILGPDIITPKGEHQNPCFNKLTKLQAIDIYIRHYKKVLILNHLGIDKIAEKIKKLFSPTSKLHIVNSIEMLPSDVEQEGEMLHGSALIFSHLFIERYDGLNSDTFMYGEESILDFIAKRDKLRCIYCPALKILHKDDSSTNYVYKRNRLKRRFYLKNLIKSMEVLRNLMIDVQYGNS